MSSNRKADDFGIGAEFKDPRALALRAMEAKAELRKSRIAALRASDTPSAERISLWESFHELRLPVDPHHRLIPVIAKDTALSIGEIHDEQKRRLAAKSEVKP
ncbi:MAG TPA: hypothetical protein VIL28_11255 [Steroidobacteraceae bacterium]|jgi:hypothetical protein